MSIYEDLAGAMAEMQQPVKDTQGYGYKYAQLSQVLGIVQRALGAHGLTMRQSVRMLDGTTDWMALRTVVFNGEGEEVDLDERAFPTSRDPQKNGSAETYARRYALQTAFGLSAEDDDGQQARQAAQQKAQDKRNRMIMRINALKGQCVAAGVRSEGIDGYAEANLGSAKPEDMTDEQLVAFGKHLAQLAEDAESRS